MQELQDQLMKLKQTNTELEDQLDEKQREMKTLKNKIEMIQDEQIAEKSNLSSAVEMEREEAGKEIIKLRAKVLKLENWKDELLLENERLNDEVGWRRDKS